MIREVKILGTPLRLVADRLLAKDDDAQGLYHGRAGRIVLDPDYPVADQGETLVHEVMEALNDRLDAKLPHQTLQTLSVAWHAVLRDNPELFRRVIAGQRIVDKAKR